MAAEPAAGEVRALLEPGREAVLSSELAVRIDKIPVREGDRFKKGDLLVDFDCALPQAQLAVVRAELNAAKKTLANARQLAKLNSIGTLEVELAAAEVTKQKAQIAAARIPVSRCLLKAPFSGRVVKIKAHAHEIAQLGQPLMEILDDGQLEIEVIIPSAWLAWLQPEHPFTLRLDETGQTHPAKVTKIGSRIDPVSQSLPVWGRFDKVPEGLIAGMSGTASFQPPR